MATGLDTFYSLVPVWAQNVGVSVYGFARRTWQLGGQFSEYVSAFRERDAWSAQRMNEYLDRRLRRVLALAFAEVPYYAERWRAIGIARDSLEHFRLSDLPSLPSTPKQDLRSNPERFVSTSAWSQRLTRVHSSGTTGTPVTAICSASDRRRFMAAREARSFGWAGTSIRKPRSMIGGRMVVPKGNSGPPFHRYNWAEKQVYFTAYHISLANAPHYVAALNHYQPHVFTGYAYSHYFLARMMLNDGLTLKYQPEALVLGSEKLTPEMKLTVRQAFGARAYEEYGAVENCMLATECEQGRLHVSPDFGIVEIVDDQGRPVPPGVEGRILCTSLLNEVQPLVRYEIGDLGAWSAEACPCGRNQLPVLQEVAGRLEDVVTGPDGRQMVRFHGIFVGQPNVVEGQIVQERLDRIRVRVVGTRDFGTADEQEIIARVKQRLGPRVQVVVESVDVILRTQAGKFKAVVSLLTPAERAEIAVGLGSALRVPDYVQAE